MRGNGIIGPILLALLAKVVVCVIFEEELHIFLAIAAEHFDVPGGTRNHRHCLCFFPQGICPQMGIELAVVEMICL